MNSTSFSPEYLAQSKTGLVTAFYSIPIGLEVISTGWRVWAVSLSQGRLGFEDYLMLWATVCSKKRDVDIEAKNKFSRLMLCSEIDADGLCLKLVAMVECSLGLVYGM